MCGRFSLYTDIEKIKEQFKIQNSDSIPNNFNIAPTEAALCILNTEKGREAIQMRFGIKPWYSKNNNSILLNARIETVAEKPAFKQSLKYRRCLIIMNGFFEWQHHQTDKKIVKQPFTSAVKTPDF